ncbi:monovalent cation/H+ antiporter subunit A [Comamonas serinivorans]|uniref:Monovalent cation/H+ antiporter subunit A n=1 Tax=Comamonas serinivorans TaxID=1082851 RepID=A0A1Y0EL32_9BURK|nr:monovalent cation/H+ antiporter subunit A [Comamonas serinivorans]ARU04297.1 monovalent cation/H+ antiporter subunit A [Comamonas serinivorans]
MSLFFLLALPFLGSAVAAVLPTNARTTAATGAALVALAALAQVLWLMPDIQAGQVIEEQMRWVPSIGLTFSMRMDGFAWMFAVLVTGIGMLVALYARYYMSKDDPVPRFFSFFLAFMGAMLGVVLSGNLIQLAFFWELTSLFSFLLIGYWYHRKDARRGARMALTVTGAGGLAMLGGVLLLGHIVGSYELSDVLAAAPQVHADPLYTVTLVLILLGALTKSAQFPFFFWLPRAMAAPTPVSAYLHSATMVKAGVFLLARLWPVLSGTPEWFWLVSSAGLITLVLGAYIANFQSDLKALLAYSTVSHLGLITLLLGLNSTMAAVAAVFHIINHATFKASLFMAVGIIDHETGTRDIRRLSGLRRTMPITSSLAIVASAAMAGVPLLNGFLSKEMFFAETVFIQSYPWVEVSLPFVATAAAIFATSYSLRFAVKPFFRAPATDLPREPHEPVRWMRVPIEALVVICLLVGVLPGAVIQPFLAMAAAPVVGGALPHFELSIWHGFNAPFVMSLVAMGGGLLMYVLLRKGLRAGKYTQPPLLGWANGQRAFEWVLNVCNLLARKFQQVFHTQRMQPQVFLLILVSIATMAASLWYSGFGWGDRPRVPASWEFWLVWVVGCLCALGAANQAKFHRLAALIMLGGAGLATCLTFIWFSAPDLALTQLAVEVVTTILFLLGLRWLPKRVLMESKAEQLRARLRRSRDFIVSAAVGSGLAVLSYALMTRSAPQSISPFYLERALPEGGGTNVVNVMLVDFRAFDTMGEIVVLGAVALTVFALLRRFRPPKESLLAPHQQRATSLGIDLNPRTADDTALSYLLVPAVLARVMLPVLGLFALHLLLRGHNEPGGGFVAALILSIGFITQYMVAGTHWVEAQINLYLRRWIAVGLVVALATGLGSLFLGYPFLTTHTAHVTLPVLGELHIASAMFFDIGVFAVVVGAALLTLTALAHQSVRRQRKPASAEPSPAELAQKEGVVRAPNSEGDD